MGRPPGSGVVRSYTSRCRRLNWCCTVFHCRDASCSIRASRACCCTRWVWKRSRRLSREASSATLANSVSTSPASSVLVAADSCGDFFFGAILKTHHAGTKREKIIINYCPLMAESHHCHQCNGTERGSRTQNWAWPRKQRQ